MSIKDGEIDLIVLDLLQYLSYQGEEGLGCGGQPLMGENNKGI